MTDPFPGDASPAPPLSQGEREYLQMLADDPAHIDNWIENPNPRIRIRGKPLKRRKRKK